MEKKIVVTGAEGQLGCCVKNITKEYPNLSFTYLNKQLLDVTDLESVLEYFDDNECTHIINAAAYTYVDLAEENQEKAFLINEQGAKNLAIASVIFDIELLHISTDYVFDGNAFEPYTESTLANPINIYGASKLAGEKAIAEIGEKYIILRTSWLYSPFGHNFYLSIKKAIEEKKGLKITTEQIGTPTNAINLAKVLLEFIQKEDKDYGIYHYSDAGQATWYDFAYAIECKTLGKNKGYINPIDNYPTKAKRPLYSVLSNNKIKKVLDINPQPWQDALKEL